MATFENQLSLSIIIKKNTYLGSRLDSYETIATCSVRTKITFSLIFKDGKRHATRCTAQKLNNSNLCTPVNTVNTKIPKPNTPVRIMEGKDETKEVNMQEVQRIFTAIMAKLEKLDNIEVDMKEIKHSGIRSSGNSRPKERKRS